MELVKDSGIERLVMLDMLKTFRDVVVDMLGAVGAAEMATFPVEWVSRREDPPPSRAAGSSAIVGEKGCGHGVVKQLSEWDVTRRRGWRRNGREFSDATSS